MEQSLEQLLTFMTKGSQKSAEDKKTLKEIDITTGTINFAKNDSTTPNMLQEQNMINQPMVQAQDYTPQEDLLGQKDQGQNLEFDSRLLSIQGLQNNQYKKSKNVQNFVRQIDYEASEQLSARHNDLSQLIKGIEKQPNAVSLAKTKNSDKNSNAIKKIGRIILKNMSQFDIQGQTNQGIQKMKSLLSEKAKHRPKDIRDGFNTSHIKALFAQCPPQTSYHNLRVARKLFKRKLRSQIFSSAQIKQDNRLLYLNTLKCSVLRFSNKQLAVRLQLSE